MRGKKEKTMLVSFFLSSVFYSAICCQRHPGEVATKCLFPSNQKSTFPKSLLKLEQLSSNLTSSLCFIHLLHRLLIGCCLIKSTTNELLGMNSRNELFAMNSSC